MKERIFTYHLTYNKKYLGCWNVHVTNEDGLVLGDFAASAWTGLWTVITYHLQGITEWPANTQEGTIR